MNIKPPLVKVRILIGIFITALLVAGFTAFPLESEIKLLCKLLNIPIENPAANEGTFAYWLALVAQGLTTNEAYPFLAYSFDWMAFAHVIIGVLFVGPFIDPGKKYLDHLLGHICLYSDHTGSTDLRYDQGNPILLAVNRLFIRNIWHYSATSMFEIYQTTESRADVKKTNLVII